MKRLLLFLALFSSSLLILYTFFMDEGEEVVIPPPQVLDEGLGAVESNTPASARAERDGAVVSDRSGAPDGTGSTEESPLPGGASSLGTPNAGDETGTATPEPIELEKTRNPGAVPPGNLSGRRGARQRNRSDEGFEATDLEKLIKTTWKNEDGTTREITEAIIRMGHVKQEQGTNRLVAEDVSFTFFDGTPLEKIVATGTSKKALFFTESELNETLQNIKFRPDCLLKDDVQVKLVGAGGADADVFSDILLLEENKISAPATSEHSGRVRIVTDTMEVAGTGMEIDLEARILRFEKEIRIDGTDFSMPDLADLGPTAPKGAPPTGEPVVITCGGPFLFTGDARGNGEKSDRPEALLGSGTLSFEGGVTAVRGNRKLQAETMTMRFDRAGDRQLGLVSLKASSPEDSRTRMDADFGQLFCRALLWDAGSGAGRSRMKGSPVIENIRFGALPGQPGIVEGLFYRMTARDEIALDMIEGDSESENGLLLTLVGGGRIEPMAGSGADEKTFFLEGDAVEFLLVAAPPADGAEESGTPAYLPSEIRINGRARVQLEGVLEADEIVLALGSSERGSRLSITMTRNAVLKHDAFWLESEEILIRVFSDGLTDISSECGFAMGVSLDAFSGTKTAGDGPLENEITVEGDRSLRLWWPGEEASRELSDAEKRALKIEGGYTIHVARPGQETITITGKERFDMGTGQHEGAQLTTLRLIGAPHIAMSRDNVEEMSLDCGDATVDLDHNAPLAREESDVIEEMDDFGPVLSHRTKPGFFTKSLVRKIVALRDVRLCYGSNIILCDSIDWDLPADLLVAGGAGEPVRIAAGLARLSGDRIEIKPEKEEIRVLNPKALFPEGQ